jgi:hypothetical protein
VALHHAKSSLCVIQSLKVRLQLSRLVVLSAATKKIWAHKFGGDSGLFNLAHLVVVHIKRLFGLNLVNILMRLLLLFSPRHQKIFRQSSFIHGLVHFASISLVRSHLKNVLNVHHIMRRMTVAIRIKLSLMILD